MIEIRANKTPWQNRIELMILKDADAAAKPIEFVKVEEGTYLEPTLSIKVEEAQCLMDELWRCGLRPTEGTGSAGSLAATERHLKDMQEITKGLLRKQGVQV